MNKMATKLIPWLMGYFIGSLILPFFAFWFSYFLGWVTSKIIGEQLCIGLNFLFNTSCFVPSMIPWIAGTLSWIGLFFKNNKAKIDWD